MAVLAATAAVAAVVGAANAKMILFDAKIVTADPDFSIAEAVAIDGNTIVAVGSSEQILRSQGGPDVDRVDLGGKTVIPGLIDGHFHFIRAAEFWRSELRLQGVTSRSAALEAIRQRAKSAGRDTWVVTLGGWSEQQFADDTRPFGREELDSAAPDNPVFLQVGYGHGYANTNALRRAGITIEAQPAASDDPVERTEAGAATGRVNGLAGIPLIRQAMGRADPTAREAGIRSLMTTLNGLGLTAVYDPGGYGVKPENYDALESLVRSGQSTLRVYRSLWIDTPRPADLSRTIDTITATRAQTGNDLYDLVAIGEAVYSPLHDAFRAPISPNSGEREAIASILRTTARQKLQYHIHAIEHDTAEIYLQDAEAIATEYDLHPLRWTMAHVWGLSPDQIDRMRRLGIAVALQSGSSFDDIRVRSAGDVGFHMPPLRQVQDSGLVWGLGTDATVVGQINPFITLGWAVTGAMPSGKITSTETIPREQALIAHTRSNAYLAFREHRVGSIEAGKLADIVVLDRDYLTVPANEIWQIKAVATMVDGRIIHGSLK